MITWASRTFSGFSALGLAGRGNLSEVPEFGGENADIGRRGGALRPLRRNPKPGEGGMGGRGPVLIVGKYFGIEQSVG